MSGRPYLIFAALLLALGATRGVERPGRPVPLPPPGAFAPSDSALEELEASRFWHAARMMRSEGLADGGPADVLLLARAEAGWENWPAVLELLEDAPWIEAEDGGSGLRLLGRAYEAEGRWADAARMLGRYAERAPAPDAEIAPALSRRARALWRAGEHAEALRVLGALLAVPEVRSWTVYELLVLAAAEGDTAGVRGLLAHAVEPGARDAAWSAEADALLAAGDTARAAAAFAALREAYDGSRRAQMALELGRLRLAAGDGAARELLLEAYRLGRGTTESEAAEALLDLGGFDAELTLGLARTVDRAGDGARALRAYDQVARAAAGGAAGLPEWARLERARLMSTVRERQDEALEEFRAIREATADPRIGARNLDAWRRMRDRQGMAAQVATLRRWLIEDYPESPEAIELMWSEGSSAEDRGALDLALERYAFIAEHAPTSSRAGEARMRSGQIHLRRQDRQAAARVFEAYLEDFPDGRRWQEAAFWAGRVRLELGDTARAREHLLRAMREQPVEYYAVMAAELLGTPYTVDVPDGEPASTPLWLREGLARLDRLREAGLARGVDTEILRLRERADGDRGAMLALAEALIQRGRTIDGINIGWALLDQQGFWDRRILEVTFPFPYRDLVRREAEEWGIDPILLAAIIRQESAFSADIVSRAGAVGLMQVMPPTGAQLARAHGPRPFQEGVLTRPEVNLHLGAAFLVEMSRRYDHDLALVLSAYNAGPTRATRWRSWRVPPDSPEFTERIPISETRGYVKSVRRNLGLYRALYGEE